MSLSIGLSRSGPLDGADYSAGVCFEDDDYYWFLYPFFARLWNQTGQMIDLYGDAVFEAEHLPHLLAILEEAVASAEHQPEEWDVRVGWRGEDQVLCKVTKSRLQGILADFICLLKRAMESGEMSSATGIRCHFGSIVDPIFWDGRAGPASCS